MFNQEDILKIMNEQLQSDEIKEYVATKVKATIKKSIDNQFYDYGKDGNGGYQTINNAVCEAIGINLNKLKLPEFQTMLVNTINNSLLQTINNTAKEQLEKNIEKLLITNKAEYTLKELLYEFMKDNSLLEQYEAELDDEFNSDYSDSSLEADDLDLDNLLSSDVIDLSLTTDENRKWITIKFQEKRKSSYSNSKQYEIRLHKFNKDDIGYKFGWSRIDGTDFKNQTLFKEIPSYFNSIMFKLFCGSTRLIITEDDLESFSN